jgi:hypothetical protein
MFRDLNNVMGECMAAYGGPFGSEIHGDRLESVEGVMDPVKT